jgi:hypothetical protein
LTGVSYFFSVAIFQGSQWRNDVICIVINRYRGIRQAIGGVKTARHEVLKFYTLDAPYPIRETVRPFPLCASDIHTRGSIDKMVKGVNKGVSAGLAVGRSHVAVLVDIWDVKNPI